MNATSPIVNWWDAFDNFYMDTEDFPLGVPLSLLLYAIAIVAIIHIVIYLIIKFLVYFANS